MAKNVGYELLSVGRTLADKLGEQLVALVMGKNVQAVAQASIAYGADQVLLVEGDEYRDLQHRRRHLCHRHPD